MRIYNHFIGIIMTDGHDLLRRFIMHFAALMPSYVYLALKAYVLFDYVMSFMGLVGNLACSTDNLYFTFCV